METNYTKKAVKSSFIVLIMVVLASFLAYLVRIILARSLFIEDFGLFYAVFTFITFFSIFKDFGLRNASVKFIAEFNVKKEYGKIKTLLLTSWSFQLGFTLLLALLVFLSSNFLSSNYFQTEKSLILITIAILYLFSSLLYLNVRSFLKGFQEMFWFSIADPLKLSLTIGLLFLFFHLNYGLLSPLLAFIFGEVIASIILLIPLFKYSFILKHKAENFKFMTKKMFNFGIPVVFTGIGEKVISYIDILLLTYFGSLTVLAVYNVVLPTAIMLLFFGTSISAVVFPMISELWAKKDKVRISSGLKLVYSYLFVIIVPLILAIFVFADILINIFFGPQFISGVPAFRILLVGVLFFIITKINFASISGIGKPAIVTKYIFIAAGLNLGLNLFLIPTYGMIGAAIATSVSYVLTFILSTSKLKKLTKMQLPWKNWLKIVLSSTIFLLSILVLKEVLILSLIWELIITILLASTIYLTLIFILKVLSIKDLKKLLHKIK
jgi:O-antigen/teichoic acid export membrane protein